MAIFSKVSFHDQEGAAAAPAPHSLNIDSWTEQVAQSIGSMSLSSPTGALGAPAPLSIPLDQSLESSRGNTTAQVIASDRPHREPVRRDSLQRRETLLRGKEGSRKRQRWENGS